MNHEQTAVLECKAANRLVIAGPGSGKTETLAEAIRRTCETNGAARVLCITFTVAGAKEMRERLALKGATGVGYIGTLHAFLLRLIKKHHKLLNLPPGISIIDDEAVEQLLVKVMDEMGCKNSMKLMLSLLKHTSGGSRHDVTSHLVIGELNRRLMREGLLTMDSLLGYGHRLLGKLNESGDDFGYDHLFVDECQDSAAMDFAIYEAMSVKTRFFVGDPDQSIFGFRGACLAGLQNMANSPGYAVFPLERNHRSGQRITEVAQRLIENNGNRYPKATKAVRNGGNVELFELQTPAEELQSITRFVSGLKLNGECEYNDMAVLCRTNRSAENVRNWLKAQGIPVAEELRPENREGIKIARIALAAVANPSSDAACLWLLKVIIGPEHAEDFRKAAMIDMTSVHDAFKKYNVRGLTFETVVPALPQPARDIIGWAQDELGQYAEPNLEDLLAYINSGEHHSEYTPGVYVGTAHSSKGREWDAVLIQGLEEGNFPSTKQDADIEEERRLCFVAITRAKRFLALTRCAARPQNRGPNLPPGPLERREPSRFLQEMGL